jgi:hypothetical protein
LWCQLLQSLQELNDIASKHKWMHELDEYEEKKENTNHLLDDGIVNVPQVDPYKQKYEDITDSKQKSKLQHSEKSNQDLIRTKIRILMHIFSFRLLIMILISVWRLLYES